jgi:hypothetical protein
MSCARRAALSPPLNPSFSAMSDTVSEGTCIVLATFHFVRFSHGAREE